MYILFFFLELFSGHAFRKVFFLNWQVLSKITYCRIKNLFLICHWNARLVHLPILCLFCFEGNRGLLLEIWNKTGRDIDRLHEVLEFHENMTDYIKSHTDRAKYYDNTNNNFVTRHSGFFVPPWTGDYSFAMKADDIALFYFSNTTNPNDTVSSWFFCFHLWMVYTLYVHIMSHLSSKLELWKFNFPLI